MKKTILSVAAVAAVVLNMAAPAMLLSAQAKGEVPFDCGGHGPSEYELGFVAGDTVTQALKSEIYGLYVGNGADVTIDMNGFTISDYYGPQESEAPSAPRATDPYVPNFMSICVAEGGKLTLRGEGYIDQDIVNGGYMYINGRVVADEPLRNYGEAVIDDLILNDRMMYNGDEESGVAGKLTINGGQFNRGEHLDLDIHNYGRSELNINGGIFGADSTDTMIYNHGVVKITNGKFVSQSGLPIITNYNDDASYTDSENPVAKTSAPKPELYISGGEFESINAESELGYEPVGQCEDYNGTVVDNSNCITQISGGYYRYFIPNADFFVEGYEDFEVDADTVQVRGATPEPEAKPEEPKEEVKNPNTFDGFTGFVSALSISFISGFGLVNFLKHRR